MQLIFTYKNKVCTYTYMCMHAHTYTCTHTHACTHAHTHTHAHTYTRMHTHTHTHTNTPTHTQTRTHTTPLTFHVVWELFVDVLIGLQRLVVVPAAPVAAGYHQVPLHLVGSAHTTHSTLITNQALTIIRCHFTWLGLHKQHIAP